MKMLNLYAGIGGNRKLWKDVEVTAVEIEPKIAKIYQEFFPNDKMVVTDAHQYLLEHYNDGWDFIWSSPPCPSHSQFRYRCGYKAWKQPALFPDMKLYEEIIFLKYFFKGKWIVENTESYYEPLIKPLKVSRHFFWSNFHITDKNGFQQLAIKSSEVKDLEKMHGFNLRKYRIDNKRQILRNCVYPQLGEHVFNCAMKNIQKPLLEG